MPLASLARRVKTDARICVAALVVLFAAPAPGALILEQDLTSLVLAAEHVVVADRLPERSTKWKVATQYRITRVLRGDLQVGTEISVNSGRYQPESPLRRSAIGEDTSAETDRGTILFLKKNEGDLRPYSPVSSGMRVVRNGRVYKQLRARGDLATTPQGPDPEDIRLTYREWQARGGMPHLTLAEFERELDEALKRVATLEQVIEEADLGPHRQTLLDLVGPLPKDRDELHPPHHHAGMDTLSHKVITAFVDRGMTHAALAAIDRCREWSGRIWLPFFLKGEESLAIARDTTRPLVERTAALWLFESHSIRERWQHTRILAELLADEAVEVRRAAARTLRSNATQFARHGVGHLDDRVAMRAELQKLATAQSDPEIGAALRAGMRKLDEHLKPYGDFGKPTPADEKQK